MSRPKSNKPKKGFLDGYKTYNPQEEGYGDPDQWRDCFHKRMGIDAAKATVGDDDPLVILGLSGNPTWTEVVKAYKRMIVKWHPDRNGQSKESNDMTIKVCAAFELLEVRYGK